MSYSPLLLLLIGVCGWPLFAFIVGRYQLRLRRSTIAKIVSGLLPAILIVGIVFGDLEASAMHAGDPGFAERLALWRGVVFALPYLLLAMWFGARLISARPRRAATTI